MLYKYLILQNTNLIHEKKPTKEKCFFLFLFLSCFKLSPQKKKYIINQKSKNLDSLCSPFYEILTKSMRKRQRRKNVLFLFFFFLVSNCHRKKYIINQKSRIWDSLCSPIYGLELIRTYLMWSISGQAHCWNQPKLKGA